MSTDEPISSTIVCDFTVTTTIPHLQAAESEHAGIVQPVKKQLTTRNIPLEVLRKIAPHLGALHRGSDFLTHQEKMKSVIKEWKCQKKN